MTGNDASFSMATDEASPHAALERFVVENDDLLELEERIGRFNIFDALRIARTEIRHSNFLAWLLDPNESHGQGSLFLKAVLMDLLKQTPAEMRPLSPIELDGEELRGVEIRREWRNIDLLIVCSQPQFVIAVENKIDAWLYNDLEKYEEAVRESFGDSRTMFVLLTVEPPEIDDPDWVVYSYEDIHRVLDRVRRTGVGSIGGDVAAFLDHYLRLIGRRFMNDPTIDELCRRIYENHRQAIDLIVDRVGSSESAPYREVQDFVRSEASSWVVVRQARKETVLCHKRWVDLLPPVGTGYNLPNAWLTLNLWPAEDGIGVWAQLYIAPTSDSALRRSVVERLTADPQEFGLQTRRKTDQWTKLWGDHFVRWDNDSFDNNSVRLAAESRLNAIADRLARIPDALRPIIDDWKKSQPAAITQR